MKKKEYYSIGIMSGTSMDGFDFSLIKSDGVSQVKVLKNQYFKLEKRLKDNLSIIIGKLNEDFDKTMKSEFFSNTQKEFSELVIINTTKFIKTNNINLNFIDVLGIHGVTLIHSPKKEMSIQINCNNILTTIASLKIVQTCWAKKWGAYPNLGVNDYSNEYFNIITKTQFIAEMKNILTLKPNIIGCCCGSTPLHIKFLKKLTKRNR